MKTTTLYTERGMEIRIFFGFFITIFLLMNNIFCVIFIPSDRVVQRVHIDSAGNGQFILLTLRGDILYD